MIPAVVGRAFAEDPRRVELSRWAVLIGVRVGVGRFWPFASCLRDRSRNMSSSTLRRTAARLSSDAWFRRSRRPSSSRSRFRPCGRRACRLPSGVRTNIGYVIVLSTRSPSVLDSGLNTAAVHSVFSGSLAAPRPYSRDNETPARACRRRDGSSHRRGRCRSTRCCAHQSARPSCSGPA